jgi:hypothetical protein
MNLSRWQAARDEHLCCGRGELATVATGLTSGAFMLRSAQRLKVARSVAPTMTKLPVP